MNIRYEKNSLTGVILADMRNAAGWGITSVRAAETAIKNTPFSITVFDSEKVIGIGRIIGDGALVWYIQDVIVLPEYQGKGIGSNIMSQLMSYAKSNSIPGENITIGLMSAKNKEGFYQKFGFRNRPNEREGSGMVANVNTQINNCNMQRNAAEG